MRKGIRFQELLPFVLYFIVYLFWFQWLEERHVRSYQIIHVFMDDYIPFCELFVIPYFLWFLYVPAAVLYAASHSREEYIRCALFLCTGMTVFLLISTFFPNIQHLRPLKMPRDNVFTHLVMYIIPSEHISPSAGASPSGIQNRGLPLGNGFEPVPSFCAYPSYWRPCS